MTKEEIFAESMSELLWDMRDNDITGCDVTDGNDNLVPEEFLDKILRDPAHMKAIKERIRMSVLEHVTRDPDYFTHPDGKYAYTAPDTYDHAYHMDEYVVEQFEAERKARIQVRYVVRLEVERIEYDPENDEEEFLETDSGETAGNFLKFEDALKAKSKVSEQIRNEYQ